MHAIDPAATAWLLASTALVLLMTPGLAIFYGGMVRTTGVLNMIMMSFISIPLVTVAWLLVGYTLAFSDDGAGGFIGDLSHVGMLGITPRDRPRSGSRTAVCHLPVELRDHHRRPGQRRDRRPRQVRGLDGIRSGVGDRRCIPLSRTGCGDPTAGWPSWACSTTRADWSSRSSPVPLPSPWRWCSVPRIGFKKESMRPHNLPFVLLGVGLLWFGWFGFNAGSALAANGTAAAIFLNTLVAGCLGMLGWLSVEQIRDGRPTTFGAASGVVAGLVAITPSCGTVNTLGAAVVGLAAGIVCSFAVGAKFRFNYDDSLDVVGRALRRRSRRRVIDRTACHRGHDVGSAGPLLRRRPRPTGQAGARDRRRRALCVHRVVRPREADRPGDGLPAQREDETTGVDLTQHAETAYAEGVHGHMPLRRPGSDER